MEISKEFIGYNEALALKELGFDEPCLASWTYKTKERIPTLYGCGALLFDTDGLITNQTEDIICSAPLYQQAFRWFREKYGWTIKINKIVKDTWSFSLENFTIERGLFGGRFSSYEETELECLKKLIEIVKNK